MYDNLTLSSFSVVCGFSTSDLAEFVELSSIPIHNKDNNYNDNTISNRNSNSNMSTQGNTSFMLYHK